MAYSKKANHGDNPGVMQAIQACEARSEVHMETILPHTVDGHGVMESETPAGDHIPTFEVRIAISIAIAISGTGMKETRRESDQWCCPQLAADVSMQCKDNGISLERNCFSSSSDMKYSHVSFFFPSHLSFT